MYSNDPKTPLRTLCYFMDPGMDPKLVFVQFPQRFHNINRYDTYGAELDPEMRICTEGMDGLGGTMFMGSGGFFRRQALLEKPTDQCGIRDETNEPGDVLALAHRVASCMYEVNTKWGSEIGFRYGVLTEDIYTGFHLQCLGWKSVICNPTRAAFLGHMPIALKDFLSQSNRWYLGLLQAGLSKYSPLTYGFKFLNPFQAICYANLYFRAFWSIPIIIYAFLPQLALLNSVPLFPKVLDPWCLLYIFLFLGAYGNEYVDYVAAGSDFKKWWNSQRMWLIMGSSSWACAIFSWLLTYLNMSALDFNVTSKVSDIEKKERYEKGIFEFGVELPLLLPINVAAIINLFAFLIGIKQVLMNNRRLEEMFVQLFIAGFVVVNSWPIYEGMVLRSDKGRMPTKITLQSFSIALEMYENMKSRVEMVVQSGGVTFDQVVESGFQDAFSKWTPNSSRQHHPTVIQTVLDKCMDKDIEGNVIPNLIYVSREKSIDKHHNFKAGALNVMLRVSGMMTGAPIILILDCDTYSNDPTTPIRALCHFLDPQVDPKLAFVQFPQRFKGVNKNDIYASEFWLETQIYSLGMDGLLGAQFMGTGGFIRRNVISDGSSSDFNTTKSEYDTLLVNQAASCDFEDNTKWGSEIGFRYGTLTEDTYTSFRLHCEGWKSVLCNPKRPAFLGGAPSNLNDSLTQIQRWYLGFLEIQFNKYNPITYGIRSMNPLQALCYAHHTLRTSWLIPIYIYAFLPQVSLINSFPIFTSKVSEDGLLLYAFLFLGAYGKECIDLVVFGGSSIQKWWNYQRMWLMWGVSSHPFALLEWSLKSFGLSSFGFNVTSKVVEEEQKKRYEQGVFEFGVESTLFLPISIASVINLLSLVKGVIDVSMSGRWEEFFMQIFIAWFVVVSSWPIYEAMVLRRDGGRMPLKITLASIATAMAICLLSTLVF